MPVPLFAETSAVEARAPAGEPSEVFNLEAPHERRGGVVVGLSLGEGVTVASGYPNNATQIGQAGYYSASGAMGGLSTTLLVMGALADYVNVGFWFSHAVSRNAGWESQANGGGLRVEAFPFVQAVPRIEGLGFLAEFGVGGGHLTSTGAGSSPGSSGTQSFVGAGVFYEWRIGKALGGRFAGGPALEYDAVWSQPFERQGLLACARLVFYGGGR